MAGKSLFGRSAIDRGGINKFGLIGNRASCRGYSSSTVVRGSFLCFGRRAARVRLSSNFFEGRMGARSRGLSFSFLIVIFGSFFFTFSLAASCNQPGGTGAGDLNKRRCAHTVASIKLKPSSARTNGNMKESLNTW